MRKINGSIQDRLPGRGVRFLAGGRRYIADQSNGERRSDVFDVAQLDNGRRGALRENMLGQFESHFDSAEYDAGKKSRNQDCRQQHGQTP